MKIEINGIPPYKQTPADLKERESQIMRRGKLRQEAEKLNFQLTSKNLKIKIIYFRSKGKADAANIIGGIADALQKIIYNDDNQIKKIIYEEEKSSLDKYIVEIDENIT